MPTATRCLRRSTIGLLFMLSTVSIVAPARADEPAARDDALRAYYAANGFLQRGLDDLAAEEYRAFLAEHGDHEKAPTARYGLGVALSRGGRIAEAIEALAPLAGRDGGPFHVEALVVLGHCCLLEGRSVEAADHLVAAVDHDDDHPLRADALGLLAESLHRAGRHDRAIAAADALAASAPAHASRARAELFAGLSAMALERFDPAAARFEAVLELDADGPIADQATFRLAECQRRSGLVAEAVRTYRRLVSDAAGALRADALHGLARIAHDGGRAEDAERFARMLLEDHPGHRLESDARRLRAIALCGLDRHEEALALFTALRSDESLDAGLEHWMARCELALDRPTDAARRLAAALEAEPDATGAAAMRYDRAVALVRAGDLDAAVALLRAFHGRHLDHPLLPQAVRLLATSLQSLGRHAECRTWCDLHARLDVDRSSDQETAALAAESAYLLGDDADAVARLERLLASEPAHEIARRAWFRLGLALHRLDRLDEATAALESLAGLGPIDGPFAPALLVLGDIAHRQGRWADAAASLEAYLASGRDPDNAEDARLALARSLVELDRPADALPVLDELDAADPAPGIRLHAGLTRGRALLALDRPDEAAIAFAGVVEGDRAGDHPALVESALHRLAGLLVRRGDYAGAAERFAALADLAGRSGGDPADARSLRLRQGQALVRAGRLEEAAAVLERLRDGALGQAVVSAEPGGATLDLELGIVLARLDRSEEAAALLAPVLDTTGRGDELDPATVASGWYELAWCLRDLDRPDEAIDAYRGLIETVAAPRLRRQGWVELAGLLAAADRHAEAAEACTAALEGLETTDETAESAELLARALYRRGVSLRALGRHADAAADLERLLGPATLARLDEAARPTVHLLAAECRIDLGAHGRAAEHLDALLAAHPDDPLTETALLRRGECAVAVQRWSAAETFFREHRTRHPDAPRWYEAQFGLGWTIEQQGRHAEAMRAYEAVTDRHDGPTAARAQFQLGECLFALDRHEEAIRALLKVDILYAAPEWSAAALYEAGRCFEALERTTEAADHFRMVTERFPDSEWADLAARHLAVSDAGPEPAERPGASR